MNKVNDMNKNETDKFIDMQQQGITNEADPIFILDEESKKNISTLKSNESIKISGVFKPNDVGDYILNASFRYKEGEEVKTSAAIKVRAAVLVPVVVDGLDDEVATGSLHEVRLVVKNNDNFTATVENIEPGNLLPESIKIQFKNKEYSLKEFNQLPESERKIKRREQLQIRGTYKAKDTAGPDVLGVKVNYRINDEKESIGLSFDEQEGGYTNVISKGGNKVIVTGTVRPKEKQMKFNDEETIEFTFENTSNEHPATGVEITITCIEQGQSEVKKN